MTNKLISCDDHMDLGQLPANLWETRLPISLRDRAPQIDERDGLAVWVCDGKVWGSWGGKPPATGNARIWSMPAWRPLVHTLVARNNCGRILSVDDKSPTRASACPYIGELSTTLAPPATKPRITSRSSLISGASAATSSTT